MRLLSLSLFSFTLMGLSLSAWGQQDDITGLERVVAIVDEDVILQSELNKELAEAKRQYRNSANPPPLNSLIEQALDNLILENIQLQQARRLGIQVNDASLNRALQNIAQQNKLNLNDFKELVERDGFSFSSFRENIRTEIALNQLHQRVMGSRIQVSQQEVDSFLANNLDQLVANQEVRLGHILIAAPGESTERVKQAKRAKAEALLERLKAGADFRQLAQIESDGQNAPDGGDLGWRKMSDVPTIFAASAKGMSLGDLSSVITSPSGYHIIKVLDMVGGEQVYVQQTRSRHILIKPTTILTDDDAYVRLARLRELVLQGEDFSELARLHSDDPGSAIEGGDLGWTNPGDLVSTFQDTMDNLEINAISQPFKSTFGWHIVQVLERRRQNQAEEFQRTQAQQIIYRRKFDDELQAWLREIKDEAFIEKRI